MGTRHWPEDASEVVERLERELATERRRVELLQQQAARQHERITSLNERLCKYEPCHGMRLNEVANNGATGSEPKA